MSEISRRDWAAMILGAGALATGHPIGANELAEVSQLRADALLARLDKTKPKAEATELSMTEMTYRQAAERWNTLPTRVFGLLDPLDEDDPEIDHAACYLVRWLNALTGEEYAPRVPFKTRCREPEKPPESA